jgi:hypothetical protein
MSYRQIEVHPEAVAEAQVAAEWYRERSNSAANAFVAEIDHAIEGKGKGVKSTLDSCSAIIPTASLPSPAYRQTRRISSGSAQSEAGR